MRAPFLNLQQPNLSPVPDTQYILTDAGVQIPVGILGTKADMDLVAVHVATRLNNHPILAGSGTDFNLIKDLIVAEPVQDQVKEEALRKARKEALLLQINILSLLDKFIADGPAFTNVMQEKILLMTRANNEFACLPGCVSKLSNIQIACRSTEQQGLDSILFTAKRVILEEDVYKKILHGRGQAEEALRGTLMMDPGGHGSAVHSHTAIGNVLSDFTKIPKKNGDAETIVPEAFITNHQHPERMQALRDYVTTMLAKKETVARVIAIVVDGLLPKMPKRSFNTMIEGEGRVAFNDMSEDITQRLAGLGLKHDLAQDVDVTDMIVDPDNYGALKFKQNADNIIRRAIVRKLRTDGYIDPHYVDVTEVQQVKNVIIAADRCGVSLEGNCDNLEVLLAKAVTGLRESDAERSSCITLAWAVQSLAQGLETISGYGGNGPAEVEAKRKVKQKIAETSGIMNEICIEKEVSGPGTIGENDLIYRLFCNNSPRVVARHLKRLIEESQGGRVTHHGEHLQLFISPHAILDKCPLELVKSMDEVAKIMRSRELGSSLPAMIIDSLCLLINYLYEIFNSGVSGAKMDGAIVQLHEISVGYRDRHVNNPNEPTAIKIHSFVEKLECPNHFEIGRYSNGIL